MTNTNLNATAILKPSTMDDIKSVKLPKQTDTYMPVSHASVVKYVETELAEQLSGDFTFQNNTFGLNNKGQEFFGMATFKNSSSYMSMAVAYRNSYNKEFSVGFAFGSQVFVCANGMFTGDVIVAKKHTLNVWESVRSIMTENIDNAKTNYNQLRQDVETMRKVKMTDETAWSWLGKLRGEGVLSARVFEKSFKEWAKPSHDEHKDGSTLQLYNAITESMKLEIVPTRAMNQRIKLHDSFMMKTNHLDICQQHPSARVKMPTAI